MWSSLDLTVGKTPVLYDGEIQILAVRNVGLYDGDTKSSDHIEGWLYLTNLRICYVDDGHPEENSCFVELQQIVEASHLPRFLRQSPKVRLRLKSPSDEIKDTNPTRSWVCEICTYSNNLSVKYMPGKSQLPICENCGVQCYDEPTLIEHTPVVPLGPTPTDHTKSNQEETKCPRCTFINHRYLRECEICGYILKQHKEKINLGDTVKMSFRAGGAKEFSDALQNAYSTIQNQDQCSQAGELGPPAQSIASSNLSHGINRLRVGCDPSTESEVELTDFGRIGSSAKLIMNMLEAHKRISPDSASFYPLDGTIIFREFARDEKSYLQQLARQVSEFLEINEILRREGGLMTLFDVYAAYNQSRGVEPVSASDLAKALQLAPELGMPIRVRALRSGTKIIESNLWTSSEERLISWIRRANKGQGVSILDVGSQFGWSIAISTEQLEQSEYLGLLCRDETSAGVQFYLNRFRENTPGI